MKRRNITLNLLLSSAILFSFGSCVQGIKEKTSSSKELSATNKIEEPKITNFYTSGSNRLVIEGNNLSGARNVKIAQGNTTYELTIASKTNSLIALTVPPTARFLTDVAYTLFVTNAYAQASFPVTFIIDNNEITTAKIADGAITSAKIDSMGANTGQALIYNGANWEPGNLNGLSFLGGYTPASGTPPSMAPNNGDFYVVDQSIVSVDIDAGGPTPTRTYASGDWVIYDATTLSWIQIDNNSNGNFWAKSTNDLNYTDGEISIGTTLSPSVLTVYDANLLSNAGDGTVLDINGDVLTGTIWARGMSFGLEGTKHVRMGASGTTDGTTATMNNFYINMNSADATPWVTADFVISSAGFVGIKNPNPTTALDVSGTVTATSFVGDGSGITNVTSTGGVTNASNSVLNADNNGSGTGEIQFNINGVNQAIIDNAGNMGLGTSTTRSELDVRSNGQTETSIISYQDNDAVLTLGSNSGLNPGGEVSTLTGTTLGTVGFAGYDGTNFASTSSISSASTEAWGAAAKGSNLIFSTTANGAVTALERMRISNSGNVGIGTTSPTQPLDVAGNINATGNITVGGNTTVTGTITSTGAISGPLSPTGGLDVTTNSGTWTTSNYTKNMNVGVDETSAFLLFPLQTNGDASGPTNPTVFGIGTSSTDGRFRIVRSSAKTGVVADNSEFEIREDGSVYIDKSLTVNGALSFNGAFNGSSGTYTGIITAAGATLSGPLSATTGTFTGAVSGTTGTFSSAINAAAGTFTGAVSGTTGSFTAGVSTTTGTFSGALTASSTANVTGNLTVDTNSLFVDAASNRVGVGTLTPGFTFDVTGDVNASSSLFVQGACALGVCTSDERFKKNIEEVEYVSDRFAKIRSVEYEWRTDEFPEKNFHKNKENGVIAQEVRDQFPELVEEDNDGYLKVNKTKLQAYAMKALKEQIVRNDKLEKENEQMKDFLCSKYADAPFCQ